MKRPISLVGGSAYAAGFALLVLVDQLTKFLVEQRLPLYDRIHVLGPVFLTHVRNEGSGFGMFQGSALLLAGLSLVFLIVVAVWWVSGSRSTRMRWGLVLLASGSFGNLVDRLARRAVVDFVDLGFWPVFNLADVLIVTGALLTLWVILFNMDVVDRSTDLRQNKAE